MCDENNQERVEQRKCQIHQIWSVKVAITFSVVTTEKQKNE